MCPLRIILIFLSAALAGFFVLKNFNSNSSDDVDINLLPDSPKPKDSSPISYKDKVMSAIGSSFWTIVDMASGRYLWKYFSAATAKSSP